jgi:iron complex transport system permease protein
MLLKTGFSWVLLTGLLLLLFIVDIGTGSVQIPLKKVVEILFSPNSDNVWTEIIWNFRMTKALTCITAGAALALAGLQMQTLFRNPLAGPDVLGLSSGASLMVALLYLAGWGLSSRYLPASISVVAAASVGCGLVFLVMVAISSRLRDNASLLIVGLMVGAGTSSIVSVLQYASQAEELQTYILWTLGTLGSLSWMEIKILTVILLVGALLSVLNIKGLNGWLLGEYYARSIGVNIKRSRYMMIASAAMLTGAVTAFCGPIAFVGLAVPHLVKLLVRSNNHRLLIPGCILGGSILLLFCDIVSQLPGDFVLPLNAITALIGAPVVIWIILRSKTVTV